MKIFIVSLSLLSLSSASYAKVYDCWTGLTNMPHADSTAKFQLDTDEETSRLIELKGTAGSGKRVTATFTIAVTKDSPAGALLINSGGMLIRTTMNDVLDVPNHLAMIKDGTAGFDFVAKMGCTLIEG